NFFPSLAAGPQNTFVANWIDLISIKVTGQRLAGPQNSAPTADTIPAMAIDENGSSYIILSDYFSDDSTPASDLIYTIVGESNPGLIGATINDDDPDVFLFIDPTENAYGTGTITIRATDSEGAYIEVPVYVGVTGSPDRYAVPVSDINQ